MNVCSRGHYMVNQLGPTDHADVGLHAKIPLIALLGLVHIRIALFLLVLGGTRRVDDAGIDYGAPVHLQAVLLEVLITQVKQLIAPIMALHEMAKLADSGFIRHRLLAQINACEHTHSGGIVQSFLGGRVGEVEPVREEVDAQVAFNPYRPTTGALRILVKRFDGFSELFPGKMVSISSKNFSLRVYLWNFKSHRSGIVASCLESSTMVNAMPYYRPDRE